MKCTVLILISVYFATCVLKYNFDSIWINVVNAEGNFERIAGFKGESLLDAIRRGKV